MVRTTEKLTAKDREYVWHPLTQHRLDPDIRALVRAEGALLYDEQGNSYIDAIASWYCTMYGHCNPYIMDRVKEQLSRLDHVVFSGFTHEPAVSLAERLLAVLPDNQEKVFYSDNGSTATEIGIKLALQFHYNKGDRKTVLLAFENGFHGDTFGAMSVSGLDVYNAPFKGMGISVKRIPLPTDENLDDVLGTVRSYVEQGDVAGFIYEPLVQGAAAMKTYKAENLDKVLKLMKEYRVINIADEVMTGFGKTGTVFASEQLSAKPDIICMSKALTAGVVPMGATSCSQEIYEAFYSKEIAKGFFHGHTYTANPISCAAALAGLDLLLSDEMQDNIEQIRNNNREFDHIVRNMDGVQDTRQLGVIYAVDLDINTSRYSGFRDKLYRYFMDQGVFLRPLGSTIYILPPYIISPAQQQQVYEAIEGAIKMVASR